MERCLQLAARTACLAAGQRSRRVRHPAPGARRRHARIVPKTLRRQPGHQHDGVMALGVHDDSTGDAHQAWLELLVQAVAQKARGVWLPHDHGGKAGVAWVAPDCGS